MHLSDKPDKFKKTSNQLFIHSNRKSLTLRKKTFQPANKGFQKVSSDVSDNSDKRASGSAHNILDAMGNIKIKLPRLYNGEGTLKNEWYVGFDFFNPATGKLQRFKKTEGFTALQTIEARIQHGNTLVTKYTGMLLDNWNPLENSRIVYHDVISSSKEFLRAKEAHYNIEYYLNLFLFEKKEEKKRDKTVSTYRTKIFSFIAWLSEKQIKNISITHFSNEHAQSFFSSLQQKKLQQNTLHSYILTLKTAWNWLDERFENQNLIIKNPWKKIKIRKIKGKPKKPFNPEQRDKILNHLLSTGETHLWLACLAVYYCFARPGRELHGLRVKHFDLYINKLDFVSEISKNRKNESVAIPGKFIRIIKEMKVLEHDPEWFVFGKKAVTELPACRDYWSKRFTKIIRGLGYSSDYAMYSWKHTGNQVAHKNKMPLESQRKQDRHHSLDQMQTYLEGLAPANSEEMDLYFKD